MKTLIAVTGIVIMGVAIGTLFSIGYGYLWFGIEADANRTFAAFLMLIVSILFGGVLITFASDMRK